MEEKLVFTGIACQKCLEQDDLTEEKVGVMISVPENVLENGIVVNTSKCNICGYVEKFESKPEQSIRKTGISRCNKCGYEYFYVSIIETIAEILNEMPIYSTCPNCDIMGYQVRLIESYGPLKHEHGHYGMHTIAREHRKVK